MKIVLLLIFCIASELVYCQVAHFPKTPLKSTLGDTIYYTLTDTLAYDYFHQQFDSAFVALFTPQVYHQVEAVNRETKKGHFKIFNEGFLLHQYEISDNKIEGIGIDYYMKTGFPQLISIFKNNELHGTTIFFNENLEVDKIALFKRRKFKKYLYVNSINSQTELKKINKHAKGPFEPIKHYQFEEK